MIEKGDIKMKRLLLLIPLLCACSQVPLKDRGKEAYHYVNCKYTYYYDKFYFDVSVDYDTTTHEWKKTYMVDVDYVHLLPMYSVEIQNELYVYAHEYLFNIYIK